MTVGLKVLRRFITIVDDIIRYSVSSKTGGKADIHLFLCVDSQGNFRVRKWTDNNDYPASDWEDWPLDEYLPILPSGESF